MLKWFIWLFVVSYVLNIAPSAHAMEDTYDRYLKEQMFGAEILMPQPEYFQSNDTSNNLPPPISTQTFDTDRLDAPITKGVYVVILNPILEHKGGQRLRQYMGWYDPQVLNQQVILALQAASNSVVNYTVTGWMYDVDLWPVKSDGFQYTDYTYLDVIEGRTPAHNPDIMNYKKFIADLGLCEKRNADQYDELWLWGFPWAGFYEANMMGPGAFDLNGSPISGTTCQKATVIMGYNYERTYDQALHSMGHRAEGVLKKVYGEDPRYSPYPNNTRWGKFGSWYYSHPELIYAGTIHNPANTGIKEYNYSGTRSVTSYFPGFYTYPSISGKTKTIDCTEWRCTHEGYLLWWFSLIPKYTHQSNSKWNNWWRYFLDYYEATNPITGDLDRNRYVDYRDLSLFLSQYNRNGNSWANLNQDSVVNILDYTQVIKNY
jgi:hypothetical protein